MDQNTNRTARFVVGSLTCFSLGLVASCVTSEPEEEAAAREEYEELPLAPVAMHPALDDRGRDIPGTLVFDTSEGRMDITDLVPDRPREFASRIDFHKWVVETLNGKLVETDGGESTSSLEYAAATTLRYDRALADLVVVEDPVAAIIGGTEGYVVIADEKVCTSRTAPCSREAGLAAPRPTQRAVVPWTVTGNSGPFGIRGNTWVASSSFLQWVGSSTAQWNTTTGVQLRWLPCFPGGPSWCLFRTGSNFLSTSFIASSGATPMVSGSASASNTFFVMDSKVVFGPQPFAVTDRTCASHFGSSGPSSLVLKTGFILPFFSNNC